MPDKASQVTLEKQDVTEKCYEMFLTIYVFIYWILLLSTNVFAGGGSYNPPSVQSNRDRRNSSLSLCRHEKLIKTKFPFFYICFPYVSFPVIHIYIITG